MANIGKRHHIDRQLEGILSHIYSISVPGDALAQEHHLSPNLEMMVVFSFGTPVSFSFGEEKSGKHTAGQTSILGPLRQMMNYELNAGADLLVLPFVYNGFYRLLSASAGYPAATLQDTDLWSLTQYLEQLWKELEPLATTEKRITVLTEYLIHSIAQNDQAVLPLLNSVADLHNPLVNPVRSMAEKTALTERTIQLRFRKYAGYSPKELIRFLRFKQVLSTILEKPQGKTDWMDLVVQFNYHDQSHLIKDFKYYTGLPPAQFLKLNKAGNFCISNI